MCEVKSADNAITFSISGILHEACNNNSSVSACDTITSSIIVTKLTTAVRSAQQFIAVKLQDSTTH